MFRARQPLQTASAYPIVFSTLERNESGKMVEKIVNQSEIVLPDVETTDISSLLAAGIDPKRVNTRIFQPSQVVVDLAEPEIKTETENEGE